MLHCNVNIAEKKGKTQMTLFKNVWQWISSMMEIMDDAVKFREEIMRQEQYKYLGR